MNFRTRLSLIIGAGCISVCTNMAYDNKLPVKATEAHEAHELWSARVEQESKRVVRTNERADRFNVLYALISTHCAAVTVQIPRIPVFIAT